MAAALSSHSGGIFAVTKTRLVLALTLVVTWWFAHILPHYQPYLEAELHSQLSKARQKIPSIKVDWTPSDDPRRNYNASKLAMIIEARPIPHLVPQILHMISVVPPDWRFLFIGSNHSVISVGRSYALKHQQVIGKLDLMILPEPWSIDTKEYVHRTLTDARFYDEFLPGVEWILKYEADSILCSNSETSLNDWLDWSWAGAPRTPDDRFSGNGGLSLRRVSAIKKVLRFQERYNDTEAEDEWFGKRLWVLKGEKVASGAHGALAVEDVFMEKPMGYHVRNGGESLADSVWKSPENRKKIFAYCPELSMIMNMKLERERCDGDNREGSIGPTEAEIKAQAEADEQRKAKEAAEEAEHQRQKEEMRQKIEEENRKKAEEVRQRQREKEKEEQMQKQKDKWMGKIPTNATGKGVQEGSYADGASRHPLPFADAPSHAPQVAPHKGANDGGKGYGFHPATQYVRPTGLPMPHHGNGQVKAEDKSDEKSDAESPDEHKPEEQENGENGEGDRETDDGIPSYVTDEEDEHKSSSDEHKSSSDEHDPSPDEHQEEPEEEHKSDESSDSTIPEDYPDYVKDEETKKAR